MTAGCVLFGLHTARSVHAFNWVPGRSHIWTLSLPLKLLAFTHCKASHWTQADNILNSAIHVTATCLLSP